MPEQRLRDQERRWQESGGLEDHVAWLRERVRTRKIQPSALVGAAYLDHPAAQTLLSEPPADPSKRTPTHTWLQGLAELVPDVPPWNGAVWVRIGLREAKEALSLWTLDDPPPPTKAIEAIEAWLEDPSPEHSSRNEQLAERLHNSAESLELSTADPDPEGPLFDLAAELGIPTDMAAEHAQLATVVAGVLDLAGPDGSPPTDCARALALLLGVADPAGLLPFLREELAPSLLEAEDATEAEWLWWGDRLVGGQEDDALIAEFLAREDLPRWQQAFRDDLKTHLSAGTPLSDGERKRLRKILRG